MTTYETPRTIRRDHLADLFADNPDGLTVDIIRHTTGWSLPMVKVAIRDLRLLFGDSDINIVCDPQGQGERWLYRIVGTQDDAEQWAANRIGDAKSRVITMRAVMASIVTATDGRTIEGREARVLELAFRHLIEDLDMLNHATA